MSGLVKVHEELRQTFERGPISHQSEEPISDLHATQRMVLRAWLRAVGCVQNVELLLGSGSVANEAICAQIAWLREPGTSRATVTSAVEPSIVTVPHLAWRSSATVGMHGVRDHRMLEWVRADQQLESVILEVALSGSSMSATAELLAKRAL